VRNRKCPVTGDKLLRKTSEADHYPTSFCELVETFFQEWNVKDPAEFRVRFDSQVQRYYMTNDILLDGWQDFHQRKAKLRWISKHGNRVQSDGGYRKRKRENGTAKSSQIQTKEIEDLEPSTASGINERINKRAMTNEKREMWLRMLDSCRGNPHELFTIV
jgi:hypothetical protein